MELTKEYFEKLIRTLAAKKDIDRINRRIDGLPTHKDLAHFATKDDLRGLPTKDDLDKFATKEDLRRFATKDDLLELATKNDLIAVRSDITEVKELVQRIDQRTDEDHRAALRDIADLKHRVSILEKSAASH